MISVRSDVSSEAVSEALVSESSESPIVRKKKKQSEPFRCFSVAQ